MIANTVSVRMMRLRDLLLTIYLASVSRPKTADRSRMVGFLKRLAKKSHYDFRAGDEHKLAIFEKPGSPILVHFEVSGKDEIFVYASVRTTSWDFEGERTDLHDTLSVGLACFLRIARTHVSSTLWDVFNPAVSVPEVELYGRYLTFPQPNESVYRFDVAGREQVEDLVTGIRLFIALLPRMVAWSEELSKNSAAKLCEYDSLELRRWASPIRAVLNRPKSDLMMMQLRRNPFWSYFRRIKPAVSIFCNPPLVTGLKATLACKQPWETAATRDAEFFVSGMTENVVTKSIRSRVARILKRLRGENNPSKMVLIPLENYCVALGDSHLICLQADCGRQLFRKSRESLRSQHEREAAVLFRRSTITLNEKIDDEVFEQMITLLLQREPHVQWARKVGHSRQPEGGKDIVVDWEMAPPSKIQIPSNLSPRICRRVLVQCKASIGPVGKSDVRDIRDLLGHNDATGFLLVVSSYLSVGLIEHLLKIRDRGEYWADWWTRVEIESRLERNLDIAHRFSSVLAIRS